MVFKAGLVSAILLNKTRQSYKTRLQHLEQQLKQKPKSKIIQYQFTAKYLIWIIIILLLMVAMQFFVVEYESDLRYFDNSIGFTHQKQEDSKNRGFGYLTNSSSIQEVPISEKIWSNEDIILANMKKLKRIINCIHLFLIIMILALISKLYLKIIVAERGKNSIKTTIFSFSKGRQTKSIKINRQEHKILIYEEGQTRFSNTNYYYSIKLVYKQQKQQQLRTIQITRKASIFHARKSSINICHILDMPYNKKVFNKNESNSIKIPFPKRPTSKVNKNK